MIFEYKRVHAIDGIIAHLGKWGSVVAIVDSGDLQKDISKPPNFAP